jgi:hypothetical protein
MKLADINLDALGQLTRSENVALQRRYGDVRRGRFFKTSLLLNNVRALKLVRDWFTMVVTHPDVFCHSPVPLKCLWTGPCKVQVI